MKKIPAFLALLFALSASISCEQQTFEQTKMFNQNRHSSHGDGHDTHGGDSHAKPAGGHAPAASH